MGSSCHQGTCCLSNCRLNSNGFGDQLKGGGRPNRERWDRERDRGREGEEGREGVNYIAHVLHSVRAHTMYMYCACTCTFMLYYRGLAPEVNLGVCL